MSERWITDASPLITLAKVGESRLLTELCDELLVPDAVAQEVLAGPPEDPARRLLESGFGSQVAPERIPPRIVAWGLGRGETEVLALGSLEAARVVLDDAAARRCASALGIPLIGTLGVVLRAKRSGRIGSAASLFRALRDAGFRIDDTTAQTVLQTVEEPW